MIRLTRFDWALAVTMLVLALTTISAETVGIYEDEGIYDATAGSIAQGRGYRIPTLPGDPPNAKYPWAYPVWLAALKTAIPGHGIWEDGLIKLSNLPFLVILTLLFRRALENPFGWDPTASRVAASMLGLSALALPYATVMMTEAPFALTAWLFVSELARIGRDRPRWVRILLLGILLYYLRTAAVAFIGAAVVWMACRGLRKAPLFLATGWGLAALPWAVWSHRAAGQFAADNPLLSRLLAYYVSYAYHGDAVFNTFLNQGWAAGLRLVGAVVLGNLETFLEGVGEIFFPLGLIYAGSLTETPKAVEVFCKLSGVALVALAVVGYRKARFKGKSIFALAAVFHIVLFTFWPWPFAARFLMPVVPVLILCVGESVRRWPERWTQARAVLLGAALLLQLASSLTLIEGGTLWTRLLSHDDTPYRPAFEWTRVQSTRNDVMLSGFASQWIGREVDRPTVRLSTTVQPDVALKLQFRLEPSADAAAQFESGLAAWHQLVEPRNGQVIVFAEASTDRTSWKAVELLYLRGRLKLEWQREKVPAKVFFFEP